MVRCGDLALWSSCYSDVGVAAACTACRFGAAKLCAAGKSTRVGFVLQHHQHSAFKLRSRSHLPQGSYEAHGGEPTVLQIVTAAVVAVVAPSAPFVAPCAYVGGGHVGFVVQPLTFRV